MVALFHVAVVWVVSRPFAIDPGNFGSPMRVVFIQRPREKSQQKPVAKVLRAAAAQGRETAAQTHNEPRLSGTNHAGQQSNPMPVVGDDVWDRPAAASTDGITFVHNPFATTYNPRPRPAPGRFRMRRQLS
ncbi:MAG: hypothetical protein KDI69_08700, partial [Xanthomonadales bacterium]|nr:hypothetical protein [Xanthomonadales bacterium]